MSFYVYILASRRNGTLYVGHTDNLIRRVSQLKTEELRGFTSQIGVKHLVWFEQHQTREAAYTRERRLKTWNRAWKLQLIETINPQWRDLSEDLRVVKAWDPRFRGDARQQGVHVPAHPRESGDARTATTN